MIYAETGSFALSVSVKLSIVKYWLKVINSGDNQLIRIAYHSYADDIQLYLKYGNNDISVDDAISRLEMCIKDICKWMSQNALKLNEDKTDYIIFSPKQNQFTTKMMNVGANKIPSSEFIKILCITMGRVLSMGDITNTCRAANMQIRKINSIRHYLTESGSKTLITSTVLTRFTTAIVFI